MNEKELQFILKQGEGQFIEFKEKFQTSKLGKEVCAFANSNGGKIFFGINDNNIVTGINKSNSFNSQIIDIGRNCDPSVRIDIINYSYNDKNIVIAEVFENKNKPVYCSDGFFIRNGANSQKLTRNEIFEFAYSAGKLSFDEQINNEFVYPDDFDEEKLNFYLSNTKLNTDLDDKSILLNLEVLKLDNGVLKFNNAGILFFAKNPSKFLKSSKVICAEYLRDDKSEILDKKEYDEGILKNIINSINFIKKKIKVRFEIETAKRKEILQFPEEAFREAVVNTIIHRDYLDKSSDIMIECYKNKLIFYNPGGLVSWLEEKDFGKISKVRNLILANLLSKTEYSEKMGTGIKRISNSMNNRNLKYKFNYSKNSFFAELYSNGLNEGVNEGANEGVNEGVKNMIKGNALKIYDSMLKNNNVTIEELSIIVGITKTNIEKNIKNLKEKRIIRRVGSDKTGHWEVKQ